MLPSFSVRSRKTLIWGVGLAVAGLIALSTSLVYLLTQPVLAAPVTVIVPPQSVAGIAHTLHAAHVINHPLLFRGAAFFARGRGTLKAGEYEFPAQGSMLDILAQMQAGRVVVHRFTLIEGASAQDIAKQLEVTEALSGDMPDIVPMGGCLPDTYHFTRGQTRVHLLHLMERAFSEYLNELWEKRDAALPYATPQEAVVLASIVEKEARTAADRPQVAAVFLNRLVAGMPLQADPTVAYAFVAAGLEAPRPLKHEDLAFASPFNTYTNKGLPPAPICNPGRAALHAVFHPTQSRDLYFVADGTGGHAFAATLQEHNRNVARWRAFTEARDRATNATDPQPDVAATRP